MGPAQIFEPRAGSPDNSTVILLHGRDSDCREFDDEFFESEASEPANQPRTLLDLFPTTRWVFPTAEPLHSERFDTTMSQWFDMWSVENPEERADLQQDGIRDSIASIFSVVQNEEKLVSRDKIFLGGISQGFATALATFLADGKGFAGLIGLCSWLPLASKAEELIRAPAVGDPLEALCRTYSSNETSTSGLSRAALRATPILLGHATDDEVVPVQNGRRLRNILLSLGFEVQWHEYSSGGHWINEPEGVDHIAEFLNATSPDTRV